MTKTITVTYKDNKYTLEYTREAVARLERIGVNIDDIDSKPVTTITPFVYAAFAKHHKNIKESLVDEIYRSIPDKAGFLRALQEIYSDTIAYLVDEPEAGNEGNATWTVNQ